MGPDHYKCVCVCVCVCVDRYKTIFPLSHRLAVPDTGSVWINKHINNTNEDWPVYEHCVPLLRIRYRLRKRAVRQRTNENSENAKNSSDETRERTTRDWLEWTHRDCRLYFEVLKRVSPLNRAKSGKSDIFRPSRFEPLYQPYFGFWLFAWSICGRVVKNSSRKDSAPTNKIYRRASSEQR